MDNQSSTPVDPTPVEPAVVTPEPVQAPVEAPVEASAPEAPVEAETPTEDAQEPSEETTPADQGAATASAPVSDSITSAPLPENPAPAEPSAAPEAPAEPVDPVQAPAPIETPPVGDKEGDAVAEQAKLDEVAEDSAKVEIDLTAVEEVQASTDPNIDGSNIGQTTNSEAIAALPRNENGQVEIDENGNTVGL